MPTNFLQDSDDDSTVNIGGAGGKAMGPQQAYGVGGGESSPPPPPMVAPVGTPMMNPRIGTPAVGTPMLDSGYIGGVGGENDVDTSLDDLEDMDSVIEGRRKSRR